MKKAVLFISLCALALSANAQFKVQSNGNIAIQTNSTAQSPIAINSAGNSSTYINCETGGKSGIAMTSVGNNTGIIYGGIFSTISGTTRIGLKGNADYGTTNIGVLGITYTSKGAGVYGTVYSGDNGSALASGDLYAGFFRGNVKITGNVTANNLLPGTLLGESASSSGSSSNGLSLRGASVASSLSGLSVTTYQKERPEMPKVKESFDDDLDGDTLQRDKEPEPDILDEQYYGKTHYALDADRLEEAFPDLVYVNKDGSKMINYMEMIPLLVQSINELNAKIEVLEGQVSGTDRKARSTTDIQGSFASQNRLYQNTPNPFKEQTVIRFSLADEVQDAAICIFDMTGKTIKKLPISSGMESISIGGYELGEGMFLYSLIVNGQEIDTKRMIISK